MADERAAAPGGAGEATERMWAMAWLRWQRVAWAWRMRRAAERLAFWAAGRLPRWLVYFAAIRLIAHATTGRYGSQIVPELGAMEALCRWERRAGAGKGE